MRMLTAGPIFASFMVLLTAAPTDAYEPDGQVLFRNDYSFNTGQNSYGASAFFSRIDGQLVVITARHLLGDAMGIEPPVLAKQFEEKLLEWTITTPGGLSVATVDHLFAWAERSEGDKLAFATTLLPDSPKPEILPLAEEYPSLGDTAFLIGCPYAEQDCKQNIYALRFVQLFQGDLVFEGKPLGISLSGFSGAPVLNPDGAVIGVLSAGGGPNNYVWATDVVQSNLD